MNVTIKQIAQEAGVSLTTVSNVINHKAHRVSDEKRQIIEAIIKKYDYSPNMNARALVQSSSRLIGLLYFSDTPRLDFSDPFVTEILEGIERKTKEAGFFTLIHNVISKHDILAVQKNWKFDGFIAVGFSQELFEEINQAVQSPIVFIDTHLDARVYDHMEEYPKRYFINTDDFQAAYTATSYLIENGHKEIAFLSHVFDNRFPGVIQQRYLGYQKALEDHQLKISETLMFNKADFQLMLSHGKEYSAVIVSADYLAMEFIYFLKQAGQYKVEETSIISFDDIKYAALNDPPLTTIRLDQISKGEQAMQLLADIIDKEENPQQITQLYGCLIVRETVTTKNE